MKSPLREPALIRFSIFEVDLRTRELRKNGVRLRIQDQPFQVLEALLERPGELVTREELQRKIWGGNTIVDFDQSLNRAVNKLRRDSEMEPQLRVLSRHCRDADTASSARWSR